MKQAILAGALALASVNAQAEFLDGNLLLSRMQSTNPVEQVFALGYVAGARDFGEGMTHCAPQNITIGQVNDIVRRALEENPTVRHHSASVIILVLLGKEWPCKPSKPAPSRSM